MENFFLPPLPDDFMPDFLIQPDAISNDEHLTLKSTNSTTFNRDDSSRVDRFPKDEDGSTTFFDELDATVDNIAQERPPFVALSRDQWIEAAAFLSQALVRGIQKKSEGMGAASLYNDLSLESRDNLTHFANDVEKLHRFFKIPYHERNSLEYCTNCLTAQGSTPTLENWKAQLETCGHDASVAKQSLLNQFIQKFNTSMHEWYEENRKMAHDEVVNRIVNPSNPPLIGADPRILEWSHRYADQVREEWTRRLDVKAKDAAQDNFTHQLVEYETRHTNDLEIKKHDLETQFLAEVARIRQDTDSRIDNIRQHAAEQIRLAEIESQRTIEAHTQSNPVAQIPVARKKRRGSISIVSSPTVMKRQALQTEAPPHQEATETQPIARDPDPSILTQILNTMTKQFDNLTKRLDDLEGKDANAYNSWGPQTWDNPTKEEEDLARKYDKFNYGTHDSYDDAPGPEEDPPNAPTYMQTEDDRQIHPDSDCLLFSGPPTPTAQPTAAITSGPTHTGLRPPERAQRVDFINPNLATDSFGMTGGRCLADGSVSFAPIPAPKPKRPPPRGTQAFSEDTLQTMSREDIRNHAKFIFNVDISKNFRKEDIIKRYLNAARNANKPGAPQQTKLSFAAVTGNNKHNNNSDPTPPRQTTPSAWSNSTGPSPPRRPPTKPRANTTTWIIRPRMGSNGLAERPFEGSADRLTDWYRQRLQANAGDNKPSLTLLSGNWANGPKSIFSLIFAGFISPDVLRRYSSLFLEKFDREHFFHPAEDMKKIALFNIPMKRDASGNVPTRFELYKEIMRGGTLAGLDYFDGPCWTPKSRDNLDATTGVAHILVRAPTNNALMSFFKRNTYMFNARIASQTAIPPRPFTQCTRCHRLNHTTDKCRLPNTTSVCSHCGSLNHKSAQHKLQCKETHDGPSCSCPPRCFLCRNARKTPSQFTGHTALDPSCPLRRYTFTPSGTTDTNPTLTHV
jgi:hypothetical protein